MHRALAQGELISHQTWRPSSFSCGVDILSTSTQDSLTPRPQIAVSGKTTLSLLPISLVQLLNAFGPRLAFRLSSLTTHRMLCKTCQDVFRNKVEISKERTTLSTLEGFRLAVSSDCYICYTLWKRIPEEQRVVEPARSVKTSHTYLRLHSMSTTSFAIIMSVVVRFSRGPVRTEDVYTLQRMNGKCRVSDTHSQLTQAIHRTP